MRRDIDLLGFKRETMNGEREGFCLALKGWCSDQAHLQVETKYGRPYADLGQGVWMGEALQIANDLYRRVATGEVPCPLLESCRAYARKKRQGYTFVWEKHIGQQPAGLDSGYPWEGAGQSQ